MTINRILFVCSAILLIIAGIVGFGWLAPDEPREAAEMFYGLLAFGGAAMALGHAA